MTNAQYSMATAPQFVGRELGASSWVTVDQDRIDRFADCTGDRQWIHVDPEWARNGPFGVTIAHGFFALSLSTDLLNDIFSVDDVGVILNYGLNRVRFPAPLPVGSRVRMYAELAEALEIEGGIQAVYHLEFEIEGQQKPCCVADLLFRYYTNPERLGPAGAARPVEVT